MITNAWYVAGLTADFVAGQLYDRTVAGRSLVIWRTRAGDVVAFDGRCRHKRFPLASGKLLDGDVIECAYHGFCYDSTGACVSAPAKASGGSPKNARLRRYPVIEQDGLVWLWPGNPERATEVQVPPTPEITSSRWDTITSPPIEVAAGVRLLIENLLDITHFYPLHANTIGNYENSKIPVRIERETIGGNETVTTTRDVQNYPLPVMMKDWFGYAVVDRQHTHQLQCPGLTRVQLRLAPPGRLGTSDEKGYVLLHLHSPIDDTHLRWWWVMNCESRWPHPEDPDRRLVDKVADSFPAVVDEDRWALAEQQRMMAYPDLGYEEVHIKSDGAVVICRKILENLEASEDVPDESEIARLRTGRVASEPELAELDPNTRSAEFA